MGVPLLPAGDPEREVHGREEDCAGQETHQRTVVHDNHLTSESRVPAARVRLRSFARTERTPCIPRAKPQRPRSDGAIRAAPTTMENAGEFTLQVEQVSGFDFRVRFDKESYADLRIDEPPPLGQDTAPNPARILAAAIGDCLSASLVFCLKRRGVTMEGLRSSVHVQLVRNEHKRLRVGRVEVTIHPGSPIPDEAFEACMKTFEDFCVVTQSVREGIDVQVNVTRS